MTTSPYILSNWVRDEHFYGRDELCRMLRESDDRCIALLGTRRIGKTSLLMRLAAQLHPHGLYCDLMRAAGGDILDEARLITLIRRQIAANAAQSPALQETRAIWEREESSLCSWLEELIWRWEELGLTMTLLWDEAEMLHRLPNSTLMPLRAILQHSPGLRIILCASKALADINERWRDEHVSPFLFGFRTEYIAGLSDGAAEQLVLQRGQVLASPATVETILSWSGKHPFLIQRLCSRLYQHGQLRQPERADLLIDAMLSDLFRVDVSTLSPGEQQILATLSQHGMLEHTALQQHTSLPEEMLSGFLEGLAQLGLLRKNGERWQPGNEYLATWLRSNPPLSASRITDRASLEVIDAQQRSSAAHTLSERERSVLRLVAAGLSNPEIGRELTISLETVKAHLKHISAKLETNNRTQAVSKARELGIL